MSTSKTKWFELFKFRRFIPLMILVMICLVISSLLGTKVPGFVANLSRTYGDSKLFEKALLDLAIIFVSVYANRVFYQLGVNKFIQLLVRRVRNHCYEKWLLHYDLQTSKDKKTEAFPQGEVLARIMNDTEAFRELITSGTFGIFIDFVFCRFMSCRLS